MTQQYPEVEELYKSAVRKFDISCTRADQDSQHTASVRMSAYGSALKALGYSERDLTTLADAALLDI